MIEDSLWEFGCILLQSIVATIGICALFSGYVAVVILTAIGFFVVRVVIEWAYRRWG